MTPADRKHRNIISEKLDNLISEKRAEFEKYPVQLSWIDKYIDFVEYLIEQVMDRCLQINEMADKIIANLKQKEMTTVLNPIIEAKQTFDQYMSKLFPEKAKQLMTSMNLPAFHGYSSDDAVEIFFKLFNVMNSPPIRSNGRNIPGDLVNSLNFIIRQMEVFEEDIKKPDISMKVLKSMAEAIKRQIDYSNGYFENLFKFHNEICDKITNLHPMAKPYAHPDEIESKLKTKFTDELPKTFKLSEFHTNVLKEFSIVWGKCNEHRSKILKILQSMQRHSVKSTENVQGIADGVLIQFNAIKNLLEEILGEMALPIVKMFKSIEHDIIALKNGDKVPDDDEIIRKIVAASKAFPSLYKNNKFNIDDHLVMIENKVEYFENVIDDFDRAVTENTPNLASVTEYARTFYMKYLLPDLKELLGVVGKHVAPYKEPQMEKK